MQQICSQTALKQVVGKYANLNPLSLTERLDPKQETKLLFQKCKQLEEMSLRQNHLKSKISQFQGEIKEVRTNRMIESNVIHELQSQLHQLRHSFKILLIAAEQQKRSWEQSKREQAQIKKYQTITQQSVRGLYGKNSLQAISNTFQDTATINQTQKFTLLRKKSIALHQASELKESQTQDKQYLVKKILTDLSVPTSQALIRIASPLSADNNDLFIEVNQVQDKIESLNEAISKILQKKKNLLRGIFTQLKKKEEKNEIEEMVKLTKKQNIVSEQIQRGIREFEEILSCRRFQECFGLERMPISLKIEDLQEVQQIFKKCEKKLSDELGVIILKTFPDIDMSKVNSQVHPRVSRQALRLNTILQRVSRRKENTKVLDQTEIVKDCQNLLALVNHKRKNTNHRINTIERNSSSMRLNAHQNLDSSISAFL